MARPREFDADEALDKAMRLFWAKGYHDSSIRDVVDRTGVNYYGLYEVFKNKHGLLLAALDRYRNTVTAEFGLALKSAAPTTQGLLGAFDRLFDLLTTEDGQVGCLMCTVATELAPHDDAVAAKVRSHFGLLTDHFRDWLDRAGHAGASPPETERQDAAAFLAMTAYSLALLLRAGFDRAQVRRQAETAIAAVV